MKKESHTSQEVEIEDGDVAYIRMPHTQEGKKVVKSITLRELMQNYKGVDVQSGSSWSFDSACNGGLCGKSVY